MVAGNQQRLSIKIEYQKVLGFEFLFLSVSQSVCQKELKRGTLED